MRRRHAGPTQRRVLSVQVRAIHIDAPERPPAPRRCVPTSLLKLAITIRRIVRPTEITLVIDELTRTRDRTESMRTRCRLPPPPAHRATVRTKSPTWITVLNDPPRLRLMMSAPFCAAKRIPLATAASPCPIHCVEHAHGHDRCARGHAGRTECRWRRPQWCRPHAFRGHWRPSGLLSLLTKSQPRRRRQPIVIVIDAVAGNFARVDPNLAHQIGVSPSRRRYRQPPRSPLAGVSLRPGFRRIDRVEIPLVVAAEIRNIGKRGNRRGGGPGRRRIDCQV